MPRIAAHQKITKWPAKRGKQTSPREQEPTQKQPGPSDFLSDVEAAFSQKTKKKYCWLVFIRWHGKSEKNRSRKVYKGCTPDQTSGCGFSWFLILKTICIPLCTSTCRVICHAKRNCEHYWELQIWFSWFFVRCQTMEHSCHQLIGGKKVNKQVSHCVVNVWLIFWFDWLVSVLNVNAPASLSCVAANKCSRMLDV